MTNTEKEVPTTVLEEKVESVVIPNVGVVSEEDEQSIEHSSILTLRKKYTIGGLALGVLILSVLYMVLQNDSVTPAKQFTHVYSFVPEKILIISLGVV